MNKKQLLKTNEELYGIIENYKNEMALLNKKLDEMSVLLGVKDYEINELKKQSTNFNNTDETDNNLENLHVDVKKDEPPKEISNDILPLKEQTQNNNLFEDIKELSNNAIPLDDGLSLKEAFAAEAIGRISYKTALLYNDLINSTNDNAKTLLALTLGKAEMFKSSVYELINTNMSFDNFKYKVNNLENETSDYFTSIRSQ